jgi:hypothetical protein
MMPQYRHDHSKREITSLPDDKKEHPQVIAHECEVKMRDLLFHRSH